MKKLFLITLLVLFNSWGINLYAQDITADPSSLAIELTYGDTTTETVTITNTGSSSVDFTVSGLKTRVLSLTNTVDMNFEYIRTLESINVFNDSYVLTEISTQVASELEAALVGQNVLLIAQQEACDLATFEGFADVLQNYANNGGTIIFTGATKSALDINFDSACIFATSLLEGNFIGDISSFGNLTVELPEEPIVENVNNSYGLQLVTYEYNITNTDAITIVSYEGNDVVVRREIGEGQVILIGHNYLNDSNDINRIIANAVKSGGGVDWIQPSALEGTISAGNSFDLDLTFDASSFFGGLYEVMLEIETEDGSVIIPVSLTVIGTPTIQVTPTSIDFSDWLVGATVVETFTIANNGTDSLFITDIVSDNPDYNVDITTAALYGGTELEITITYTPSSIETDDAELLIYNNASENPLIIALTGIGVGGPLVVVEPESLEITLNSGESTTEIININNIGEGPLDFTIELSSNIGGNNILVPLGDLEFDIGLYNNIMGNIYDAFPALDIVETITPDPAEFESLLQESGMLIVPGYNNTLQEALNINPDLLIDYLDNGGNILFLNDFEIPSESGLFEGDLSWPFDGDLTIADSAHPITQGVPEGNYVDIGPMVEFASSEVISVMDYDADFEGTGSVAAYREQGNGLAVFLTFHFFETNSINLPTLLNSVEWLHSNSTSWFSFSPESAEDVPFPNGLEEIEIQIDSEGLLGGTYYIELILNSNGPVPVITIPVTLTVVGVPQIDVETTQIDFGNVILGDSFTETIIIDNPGTDTLYVTNITSDYNDVYLLDNNVLTIPPLSSATITLTFTPDTAQDYTTTLTLENNVGTVTIDLIGVGINTPTVEINDNNIEVSIVAGESTTETVVVNNTGLGPLDWTLPGGNDALEIVFATYSTNTFNHTNLLNALDAVAPAYNLTQYDGFDPVELGDLLNTAQILLIPSWNFSGNTVNIGALAAVYQQFAQNGGTIIVMGTDNTNCINQSGLFASSFYNYLGEFGIVNILEPNHPLTQDLPSSFVLSNYNWIGQSLNSIDVNLIEYTDFDVTTVLGFNEIGVGKAIYIGFDYNTINPNANTMLGNAVAFGGALPEWLIVNSYEGSINPDGSYDLDITLNADGLPAGIYTYILPIFTNDPLNPVAYVDIIMNVEAFPQAVFSGTTLSCDGYAFFNDLSVNDPITWTWDFGDGTTSNEQDPIHLYTEDGTYSVVLEACNDLGCDVTGTIVEVNTTLQYCDTLSMPLNGMADISTCTGVLYDNGGEGPYQAGSGIINISPPGAVQLVLTFTEFAYAESNSYIQIFDGLNGSGTIIGYYSGEELPEVTGIITSETGMISIVESVQFVNDNFAGFEVSWACVNPTTPPTPNFTADNLMTCDGLVNFTDETAGFPAQWSWDFGDGTTSNEQNPEHNFSQDGTYMVSLEACNTVGCETYTMPVTVLDIFSVDVDFNPSISPGIPSQFEDNSIGAISWEWDFGNGASSTSSAPTVTYFELGVYTITLIVSDGTCERTATWTINVSPVGINDVGESALLQIYPNPTAGNLQINYPYEGSRALQVDVVDAVGRVVKSEQVVSVNGYQSPLNLSAFAKGQYIIRISSSEGIARKQVLVH